MGLSAKNPGDYNLICVDLTGDDLHGGDRDEGEVVLMLENEWMWASSRAAGPEVGVAAAVEMAEVAAWVMKITADS